MSETTGIRISELTPTDSVGLSDLFIVSQYNGLSGTPDNEKYVSKSVTSDVLSRHLLDIYSDYLSQKISEGVSTLSVDMTTSMTAISTDLGYAISAILGLDACRQKFKGETTQSFSELQGNLDRLGTDLTKTVAQVSTALSDETSKTVRAVSSSLVETMTTLSERTFGTISNVSAHLKEYSDSVVENASVHLSNDLTHTIGNVSVECMSSMELCVDTVSMQSRLSDDFLYDHILSIQALSLYYDPVRNDIVLTEPGKSPYIKQRLNRDDIFIDLLSDLTIDSLIDNVKCDRTNLSVWFKVGNPPKKRPIVFPLSTFHHNYIFDKMGSGLSVDHPISGNISVGVDFGQVSSVMTETFYTKGEIDRNIYTKTQADKLLKDLSNCTDELVSAVSAETLSKANERTDLCVSTLDGAVNDLIRQVSADMVGGDASTLSSAEAYADAAATSVRLDLTSIIEDGVEDIRTSHVRKDSLSTQTWYLYTDQSPDTPIPFNIVLSVGSERA